MVLSHFIRFTKLLVEINGKAANKTTATKRNSLAAFPSPIEFDENLNIAIKEKNITILFWQQRNTNVILTRQFFTRIAAYALHTV